MICREPYCLTCVHFQGHPKRYGDSAYCKLLGNIPDNIYWEGSKCDTYGISPEIETKIHKQIYHG